LGILDERGDLIARFDLPVIGEGKQRRIDAASLADFILQHASHASRSSSRPARVPKSWNPTSDKIARPSNAARVSRFSENTMRGDHLGRVFISYSRRDGAAFARDLRAALEKQNVSAWQDLIDMEGGQDWWSQIENALRSKDLQHFILVATPAALESGVVRQEIRPGSAGVSFSSRSGIRRR
jgi:TIR domain